jgi:hypothetical protein
VRASSKSAQAARPSVGGTPSAGSVDQSGPPPRQELRPPGPNPGRSSLEEMCDAHERLPFSGQQESVRATPHARVGIMCHQAFEHRARGREC